MRSNRTLATRLKGSGAARALRHGAGLLSRLLLALAILLATPGLALAAEEPAVEEPTLTEAQKAVVTDADGNILWGMGEYDEVPMASITKVMTAMVAIDSGISFDREVTIVDSGLPSYSNLAGFEAGTTVTFGDLMNVMLVFSANDAAYNLACCVAGNEQTFVKLMNAKAEEIGLEHTHFANSHGLEEDGHYSCAADLAVLGRYAMENYPEIAEIVQQQSVTITVNGEEQTFESTDDLMGAYDGLIGIKTGKTEYGCSFLGAAERNGLRFYTVVLGCATSDGRFADTRTLLDWAYYTYYRTWGYEHADLVPDLATGCLSAVASLTAGEGASSGTVVYDQSG